MITEDYVSFKIAKLLNEKGFEGQCHFTRRETETTYGEPWNATYEKDIPIPTLQMAMKWLREVHHLTIDIFHFRDWKVNIKTTDDYLKADYDNPELKPSETYEEACEAAIKYCLENLI